MIHSYVFSDGKVVATDVDSDALRLVRADKGLQIWVDLDDPTPEEAEIVLERIFAFHPLAIEDCLAVSHFPKAEDYGDYLFLVLHAVDFSQKESFHTTELDIFLGREFLVTHHTRELRSIKQMQDRLCKNAGNGVKSMDRLLHMIVDMLVDKYQPALDKLTQDIGELEDFVFGEDDAEGNFPGANPKDPPGRRVMQGFRHMRKQVGWLRKIIRPQRDLIMLIAKGEYKLIRPQMLPYFRDVYDELTRIDEHAHSFSDQLFVILDVWLNKAANQTNEIIRVLTILTVLTTPVTLIGTWYGMNFENMPELKWTHSYAMAAVVTVSATMAMVLWLKWKKWL